MKNWNIWFFIGLLVIIYFGESALEKLTQATASNKDKIEMMRGELSAIAKRLDTNDKDRINFYKVQKNQDVWSGTACINCHNSIQNALPINKISIAQAMEIVRNGNENTKKGGMPTYTSRATRDKNSITDADLKVRLDALYTKELLDYAKEVP